MLRWCSIEIVPRFFRPVVALPIVLCGAAGVAVIDKKASLGHEKAMTYGGAITLVFVLLSVWLMGIMLILAFSLSGLLTLAHAAFRCRSGKSKLAAHMQSLSPDHLKDLGDIGDSLRKVREELSSSHTISPSKQGQLPPRHTLDTLKGSYKDLEAQVKRQYV